MRWGNEPLDCVSEIVGQGPRQNVTANAGLA
jgi:hypothetical protein